MVQQSKKIKIKNEFWYYVDLEDPLNPKVLKDFYEFYQEVVNCMKLYLKDKARYFAIKGEELKKYKGQFKMIKPPYRKFLKYNWREMPLVEVDDDKQRGKMRRRRLKMKKARELGVYKANYEPGKYDYPEDCVTWRQKKTFREMQRRKMIKGIKIIY